MWHPFKYRRDPVDAEGIAKAGEALSMARQIEMHAVLAEQEHREILRRNNFGPKIHRALGGK